MAIGAVVVVADDRKHAVVGTELGENGGEVGELGRLERHNVAGEGDKVRLEGVGFVHTTLQCPLAV